MKKITIEQINSVLQAFYQTNISARDFDVLKKFFEGLPEAETTLNKLKKDDKTLS